MESLEINYLLQELYSKCVRRHSDNYQHLVVKFKEFGWWGRFEAQDGPAGFRGFVNLLLSGPTSLERQRRPRHDGHSIFSCSRSCIYQLCIRFTENLGLD